MARMTDEEAEYWDEYYTKNTIMPTNEPGFFAKRKERLFAVDDLTAKYLTMKAAATHKTPAQIIGEWAREKVAVAAL